MPLEVQGHAIPHIKAKLSGKFEPRGPSCSNTFILCLDIFKNPVLLHNEDLVPFVFISTVNATDTCRNCNQIATGLRTQKPLQFLRLLKVQHL